jgi:hypothetical protein
MRARFLPAAAFALSAFAVSVLGAAPAAAQSIGESIQSYDVNIQVERGGAILVVERIVYDFDGSERHGILRDIPVRLTYDRRFDRVFPLDVISVEASDDTPHQFKKEKVGNELRLRIGDPDRTITGIHTYTITYRVLGAMNAFADHDELYWNAIGTQWDVPIDQATVHVSTPAEVLTGVACFAGSFGSNLPCDQSSTDGSMASFAQAGLSPGEGLTVVVGLPKGVVPHPVPILKERFSLPRAFSLTPVTASVAVALLVALVAWVATMMWRVGRDRRTIGAPVDVAYATPGAESQSVPLFEHPVIPVEYAPPDDIRPGQLGTLVDEQANPLDVTASMVDLAVRGYLRIEEIPKEGWFGKPDWRLVKLKNADPSLLHYEALLLDSLFQDAEDMEDVAQVVGSMSGWGGRIARRALQRIQEATGTSVAEGTGTSVTESSGAVDTETVKQVKLSSLKQHFVSRLQHVQKALYADAVERGWFAKRPDKVRGRWVGRGVLLLIAGVGLMVLLAVTTHLALIAVPVALAGIVLLAGAHAMPSRTPKGTGLVRRIRGFRTYIDTAEKQEARFQERENIFSKYLPYAIVFGLTEKWAHAFAALGQEASTASWYVGTHPFVYASFASSIDHFTVSTAGTIASTPGGSGRSGFGGGGFSGGGGGGGGGGSW